MAKWNTNAKHDVNSINNGNKYDFKDRVSLEQLNAITENSFYASDIAENVLNQLSNLGTDQKIEFKGSNPNLLINGDFRVNQRGVTSYVADINNTYSVDRWCITGGAMQFTYNTSNNTVTLNNTSDQMGYFIQLINPSLNNMWGKTFTMSCQFDDGTVLTKTITFPVNKTSGLGLGSSELYNGINLRGYIYNDEKFGFTIDVRSGANATIKWCKLEIGSVATAFSPRPYAEELALCQRYYQILRLRTTGFSVSDGSYCRSPIYMPATLRIEPTLKINIKTLPYVRAGSVNNQATNITLEYQKDNLIDLRIFASGLSNGTLYAIVDGEVIADAEIY